MNQIVPAQIEHIDQLVSSIRAADVAELKAIGNLDPEVALKMSFCLSTHVYTWLVGDKVGAVFGVAPIDGQPGTASVWMIGSDLIRTEKRFFIENSRRCIDHCNTLYPLLENYVHPNNRLVIRWLEWCGFEFDEPEPYGSNGELFLPFHREL